MSGKTKKKEKKHEEVEIEYITDEEKKPEAEEDELKVLQNKLKKREAETSNIKNEMEKLKDNLLRQLAEKENLRKRLEREKNDYYDYALSEFLKELLVILDNFERAIESEDEVNGKSLREGVKMIHKQYRDLLMKQGVKPIEIKENKFDPHLHQAFIIEESEDVKEPVVSEELQRGYMLHSRLLRPSLVKVMVPKKDKST
jgi:molecular chaperone GrpE